MSVMLRPVRDEDELFLRDLYARTREVELAQVEWSESQKERFLVSQYTVQKRSYKSQYPRAVWKVILEKDRPVGRLIIDRRANEIGLMDIALLPEHRGKGIGSTLIRDVMGKAKEVDLPVRLFVGKDNPGALRLYRKLGFVVIGEPGGHYWMEWCSTGTRPAS